MFFDTQVLLENKEECQRSAWSNSDLNAILAVATNKPRVLFMNDEGSIMTNHELQRGNVTVATLKWHPVTHALAIGWADGCITLWQEDSRLTRDEKVSLLVSSIQSTLSEL